MINSINVNSINNINNTSRINETNNNPQEQYTDNKNLITKYLDSLSAINTTYLSKKYEMLTPSNVEGYNNYREIDDAGNELVNVHYAKDGNFIVQSVKTKSLDGSTIERITKNSSDTNSISLVIKDKNENVLLTRDKSYKKIDDDNAQTVVDGEIYNISGLKSHIIKIEHKGDVVNIDLDKMLNNDVIADKDKYGVSVQRNEKINDEEKEALFAKIKELNGDDLIRLSQSVQTIQYFAGMDEFFVSSDKSLQLQISDKFGPNITVHELGHAFNHKDEVINDLDTLISAGDNYANIRHQTAENYQNNKNNTENDRRFYGKFLDTKQCMQFNNDDEKLANCILQDEIYAESYCLLNTTNLIDFEGGAGCPGRMLSMMKYMPSALVEVNKSI